MVHLMGEMLFCDFLDLLGHGVEYEACDNLGLNVILQPNLDEAIALPLNNVALVDDCKRMILDDVDLLS